MFSKNKIIENDKNKCFLGCKADFRSFFVVATALGPPPSYRAPERICNTTKNRRNPKQETFRGEETIEN